MAWPVICEGAMTGIVGVLLTLGVEISFLFLSVDSIVLKATQTLIARAATWRTRQPKATARNEDLKYPARYVSKSLV